MTNFARLVFGACARGRALVPIGLWLAVCVATTQSAEKWPPSDAAQAVWNRTLSLDGEEWLLAIDPKNVGKTERWFTEPQDDARPTRVPWVIQDAFPDYHGVVWYWREFACPRNPDPAGRTWLRFWNVDYLGEVWVNDRFVGSHEGAEGAFELDITEALLPGKQNRLAVRVLNPRDEPIDGVALAETPHRNKTTSYTFGCDYNHGGIEDSVELLIAAAVRIVDIHAQPEPSSGAVRIDVTVQNALDGPVGAQLEIELAPARNGETLATARMDQRLKPGTTQLTAVIPIERPTRWDLDNPYLYRVSAAVRREGQHFADGRSVRFGFRDFRIDKGYFTLNGRRIFLRSSHTGNMAPIGIHLPWERDWFRQDILSTKALGFNMIRFIAGLPNREQLEMCDELGMLVYEEPSSAWLLKDSPSMAERFNRSVSEMLARDRNHPSVVMWGLLNETHNGPVFRHAVEQLSAVRKLDQSRIVMLNSGRFDCDLGIGSVANPGSAEWQLLLGAEGVKPAKALTTIYPSCVGSGDAHIYPQVPHSPEAINLLQTYGIGHNPFFLSEYGVASPVDLIRVVRQYEQRGKGSCGEALFYQAALEKFQADWKRWNMDSLFGRPEEFFAAAQARVASQRLLGINAVRANPRCNGYNLTGTVDQGYSGEGLTTPFRELKPGTSDALFEALAPLRLCTFVEPYHVYRDANLRLRIVLANEDRLPPGTYPLRVDILNERSKVVFSRQHEVNLPRSLGGNPNPFAFNIYDDAIAASWPEGKYRVRATFERSAAATGGNAEFYVSDPPTGINPTMEVMLLGDDATIRPWLEARGATVRDKLQSDRRQVILVSGRLPSREAKSKYRQTLTRVACGSTAIFLSPETLAQDGLQLPCKGKVVGLPSGVYHKEEWNYRHAVFAGMPTGGLMDYVYYRTLIPSIGWQRDGAAPATVLAGAIQPAPGSGYASGLLLFADGFGAGECFVNTLRVRENLDKDPAADRLLSNLLTCATRHLDAPPLPPPADLEEQLAELAP